MAELPQLIRDNWEYQKQKTGWVGLTVAGGVDEHGRIVQMTCALSHSTVALADDNEQPLCAHRL